ncbi:cAMP and cAMP-inhibited cGMP 3',5'-cyclic phosphodiesterase 10A-like [Coccinella septempunctata]|uniref:cAMP and cAMP-inhibited cGMP 3',5'-cyclic phosphodiesterase 10A-like n=1 Tax=Coccinella septempunctata TaxID=41139 RepID=UPI001D06232F|nr:cAMP and cAMP-inhibited cGMP 3',5'-cyclic phosphodiesterase 10A-like [Coccinella septempunctata]
MFRRKYLSLFPNTVKAKNVVAPYNRKAQIRSLKAATTVSDASFTKRQTSQSVVNLKEMNDFSSKNPHLHALLLEAGDVLKNSTDADGVSVYMVDKGPNEIYLLTGDENDVMLSRYRFEIKRGNTVAAHVAFNKENVMVENFEIDARFPEGTGFKYDNAESVLGVPVVTPDGECYAVFEMVKEDVKDPFNKDDLKVSIVVAGWMGAAIHQNLQRQAMLKQASLHNQLLEMTGAFFSKRTDCNSMITELMNFLKDTLEVSRGTFFLIDKECDELTAEVYEEGIDERNDNFVKKSLTAKLLQKDRGIASLVARTGKRVNVKDPVRDRRIGDEYELRVGRTIKTLLCMPIANDSGLVGIFHLLNKKYGIFTRADEGTLKTFTKYTSCCLQYNIESKKLHKAEIIYNLYNSHLKRLMRPCSHDYDYALKTMNVRVPNLLDFRWYIPEQISQDSPQIAVYMVKDLCDDGNLNNDNLLKFMLTARRLYRKVPYHNFDHAFNFMHCMYNILKRNKATFTTFEMKALLISSIGHDIDHSGYTNNFLHETDDVLYRLYQESSWENYHFLVTSMLFDQYPIFNTTPKTYKTLMREMKDAILATDLQRYFKNSKTLIPLIRDNNFDTGNAEHRYLMKAVMMTVSDLSGQCKPYSTAKRLTDNVYREFYDEGDKYKKRGLRALPLMDRDKQNQIPEEQIQFLSFVVLPATRILESILSNIDLSRDCVALQKAWHDAQTEREKKLKKKPHSFV